jgi:predicted O-methyltransferase YrrM
MSSETTRLSDGLYAYMLSVSLREPECLVRLREETASFELARMQVSPEQGQFMALLTKLIDARKVLEIGVFTGYSSLCMALALPEKGRIVACDVNESWTSIARRHWRQAKIDHKIDLRLAPAVDTMAALIAGGESDTFDMVFIDADKENYATYYELSLKLVKQGGLILIDNVLWHGRVLDREDNEASVVAIRNLNEKLRDDDRVEISLLPIGDGVTLVRKR